jgi:hypothetical protein
MITQIKKVSNSNHDIADKLAALADTIRGENPDGLFRIILAVEGATTVEVMCFGKSSTRLERLGLLEYAKLLTCGVEHT